MASPRENCVGSHYLLRGSHARQTSESLEVLRMSDLRACWAVANASVSLSKIGVFGLLDHLHDRLMSPLKTNPHHLVEIIYLLFRGWFFWGLSLGSLLLLSLIFRRGMLWICRLLRRLFMNFSFCWLSDNFSLHGCLHHT